MKRTHCQSRGRRTKRNRTQAARKDSGMGAGNSQPEDLTNFPRQDSIISQELGFHDEVEDSSREELDVIPDKPDGIGKCPHCSSSLKPVANVAGPSTHLLQCPQCPGARLLCEHCLYPCTTEGGQPICANRSCQVVSLLLTCKRVTDPVSKVRGCPMFRTCPKCHSLMMHAGGCKYVTCMQCHHKYCFICLRYREVCTQNREMYMSLRCSQPRAARQRFQT